MRLTIKNLPALDKADRFHALFGRYVYGFKPWTHCQDGLLYRQAPLITPKLMETSNPDPIELHDDLFYLCAVG